jgi:transposase-like protein
MASRPDELVRAMGMDGIFRSQVSRLCEEIDDKVKPFLGRPIEGDWPHVWRDAAYVKVRRGGRIVSTAIVIAIGVNDEGGAKRSALAICPSEAATFWGEFLRQLARRGLRGAKLVVDAHEGLKAAVTKVLGGLLEALPRSLHAQRARARQQERPPRRLGLHRHGFRARLGRRRRQAMA